MKNRIIVIVSVIVLLFTGCTTTPKSSKENNTLIYGSGEYTRINPLLDEHGEINLLIFNGLTANDENNEIVPCLAESWELDEHSNTYVFKLRDDVKWHDGEKFTAEDVKFTIESIINPENQSEIASNYEDIEEINIINDYMISFKLKEKNVAFIQYMNVGIVPKHLLENEDIQSSDYFRKPIGTGPYKVESFNNGENIILKRNNEYFKGVPNIENIVFKFVLDDNAMALQLLSGELDLAKINSKNMESFKGKDEFKTHVLDTADYRGIMYNFNNEKWIKNKAIIPAINYGVNRQDILESVILGQGEVAYGPLQKSKYNNSNIEKYEYSIEKAKEIIETEGWKLNNNGFYEKNSEVLGFKITCMEGDDVRINMGLVVAQQLKEIGIDVKVEVPTKMDWENYETYLVGWGSPFDPDDHTYKVFGTNKGSNFSGYSNSEVDRYLTEARQSDDFEVRKEAYYKFQEELAKDPAYTFICYLEANYVGDKNIKGITEQTALGHHGVGVFWNVEKWSL